MDIVFNKDIVINIVDVGHHLFPASVAKMLGPGMRWNSTQQPHTPGARPCTSSLDGITKSKMHGTTKCTYQTEIDCITAISSCTHKNRIKSGYP